MSTATLVEREVNTYTYESGRYEYFIVEQTPGHQMIWWNDYYPDLMPKDKDYIPYLLPFPYTLFVTKRTIIDSGYGNPYGTVLKCMNKTQYKKNTKPNGYLIPLPTMNFAFSNCGSRTIVRGETDEEKATTILQSFWGSAFCKHWYEEATWNNPFWKSFGVAHPNTSWNDAPKGLLMSVLQKWADTPLEDIMKKNFGTRQLTAVLY